MFCVGSAVDNRRMELCIWETHSLNCSDEGQIIILSANYGQIAEGRCNGTTRNCSGFSDVRSVVKSRCEQSTSCMLELPDKDLDAMTPNCSKSAIAHLEIVYQCRNGEYFLMTAYYVHLSRILHRYYNREYLNRNKISRIKDLQLLYVLAFL